MRHTLRVFVPLSLSLALVSAPAVARDRDWLYFGGGLGFPTDDGPVAIDDLAFDHSQPLFDSAQLKPYRPAEENSGDSYTLRARVGADVAAHLSVEFTHTQLLSDSAVADGQLIRDVPGSPSPFPYRHETSVSTRTTGVSLIGRWAPQRDTDWFQVFGRVGVARTDTHIRDEICPAPNYAECAQVIQAAGYVPINARLRGTLPLYGVGLMSDFGHWTMNMEFSNYRVPTLTGAHSLKVLAIDLTWRPFGARNFGAGNQRQ